MGELAVTSNGHMPIKTVDIALDEMGWPGWLVTMRTDPPSSVYDSLIAFDEAGGWWPALGKLVISWNITGEDGHVLPLPKDVPSESDIELRVGLMTYVFTNYLEAVKAAAIPKGRNDDSPNTSPTSGESPSSE